MSDESLLQFPCDFPIKVMGRKSADFRQLVTEIVVRHAPDLDEAAVSVRESRTGRYQSVTLIVRAQSREQLDAIYRALTGHERVVIAL